MARGGRALGERGYAASRATTECTVGETTETVRVAVEQGETRLRGSFERAKLDRESTLEFPSPRCTPNSPVPSLLPRSLPSPSLRLPRRSTDDARHRLSSSSFHSTSPFSLRSASLLTSHHPPLEPPAPPTSTHDFPPLRHTPVVLSRLFFFPSLRPAFHASEQSNVDLVRLRLCPPWVTRSHSQAGRDTAVSIGRVVKGRPRYRRRRAGFGERRSRRTRWCEWRDV